MTPKRNPSKNWGRLLLLSLLVPGILSCGTLSTPIVTPTVIPTLAPIPTPALPEILEALKPVLQGHGVSEAGAYDPNSPTPPHIVIMDPTGKEHEYNDYLCFPPEWQPSSISDTELVVVIGPKEEVMLNTAIYIGTSGGSSKVTRYASQRDVHVLLAQTGAEIPGSPFTVRGMDPGPFPEALPESVTSIVGSDISFGRVFTRLQEVLCRTPGQCPSLITELTQIGPLPIDEIFALSPNGQFFVAQTKMSQPGKWQGSLEIRYTSDGKLLHKLVDLDSPFENSYAAFSPDGKTLVTEHNEGVVRLWNVSSGQLIHEFDDVIDFSFSPDWQILALRPRGLDNIQLWQVADWALLRTLKTSGEFRFSPLGDLLAVLEKNTVQLWRIKDGKRLFTADAKSDDIAFSPDGQLLAYLDEEDGEFQVIILRISDRKKVATGRFTHERRRSGYDEGFSHMRQIEFSPDGQTLFVKSYLLDTMVVALRPWDGQMLYKLQDDFLGELHFSPDGQYLYLSRGYDDEYAVLRTADGQVLRHFYSSGYRQRFYFLPDGQVVVFEREDKDSGFHWVCRVDLWNKAITR